ncbi:hypothetical protein [Paenibacillus endoradicis]|uniref:hypothetical protein n=1 Tax=Paenibacillus endoradicis TaxID=2972487 RepID=UPI002158F5A3|nr:hypothetical protein [Paenibacillus endoradicis]MCR8656936.1 hypothetical protein [Paenibacillus endoradicis]
MTNRILNTDTYHDEVRSRLGVGEDVVSNTEIDAPSVIKIAEAKVISSVPNYDVLEENEVDYLYAAVVCMVAAILAPSMSARIKKAKKDFDFTIENREVNWSNLKDQLMEEVNELISLIVDGNSPVIPVFGLAGPTRFKESNG